MLRLRKLLMPIVQTLHQHSQHLAKQEQRLHVPIVITQATQMLVLISLLLIALEIESQLEIRGQVYYLIKSIQDPCEFIIRMQSIKQSIVGH